MTLRIGDTQVGLVGLEPALQSVLNQPALDEDAAVEHLFSRVEKKNYIPPGKTAEYRQALRREYRRRLGKESTAAGSLTIRVLGKPCIGCNKLYDAVVEILQRLDLAADLEKVEDPDEIYRYSPPATPALVINGEIKSSGRQPTPAQIEEWLTPEVRSQRSEAGQDH